MESRLIQLSIIIPTLDRQKEVFRILSELNSSKVDQIEVIVVDDSKESINEKLNFNYPDIIYIHRGKKLGVSSARNLGAKAARGNYLIFLDDDDSISDTWLIDFKNSIEKGCDLVYCKMLTEFPNGKKTISSPQGKNGGIVIPGAWMILKSVFLNSGGYDSRLKFAENTELFFRLGKEKLRICYIDQINFIYRQSIDGGSKDLKNMLESLHIILEKHRSSLTPHVKHLYYQNIGVIQMRFRQFSESRKSLALAIKYKPSKISTYLRFGLATVPFFARKVYSTKIKQK